MRVSLEIPVIIDPDIFYRCAPEKMSSLLF